MSKKEYLATFDPKLEEPDTVGLEELLVHLRVWLRAEISAGTHKKRLAIGERDQRSRMQLAFSAHTIDRSLRVSRKRKLVVSGNPDRKTPSLTMAKFSGGTNTPSATAAVTLELGDR